MKRKKKRTPKITPLLRNRLKTLVVFDGPKSPISKDKVYLRQA